MRGVSSNEDADFEARVKVMKEFMGSKRYKHTTRPYKAGQQICRELEKSGEVPPKLMCLLSGERLAARSAALKLNATSCVTG